MDTTYTAFTKSSYELLKILLGFVSSIIWPLTVFIILFIFKQEIKKLLTRTKKLELPGGFSIEIMAQEIQQGKDLANEVKSERNPEVQEIINRVGTNYETEANLKMIELGLQTSPSGLDLTYYKNIAEADPRLALVGLRSDLEIILKNLAKGFNLLINEREPIIKIISKLLDQGSITSIQFQYIMTLYGLSNSAAHGALITKNQA